MPLREQGGRAKAGKKRSDPGRWRGEAPEGKPSKEPRSGDPGRAANTATRF